MNLLVKRELRNTFYIVSGSILLAIGLVMFLTPNRIATGGSPGFAILLHHILDMPLGMLMIGINAFLLAIGWKFLGKGFIVRTIIAIALTALIVDLFVEIMNVQALVENTMLATIYGGIAVGFGVGFIMKGDASAGGSTIVAKILSMRSSLLPGQVILIIDIFIIISSAFVFRNIELSLWSMISIYVTSQCIDLLLTGTPNEKIVHIVSDRVELLSHLIAEHVVPRGTIFTGKGLMNSQEKNMIFVVVETRRISILKDLVKMNDPDAFMVVMKANEMLGRGH